MRKAQPRQPARGPSEAQPVGGLLEAVLTEFGVADKVRECQALLAWEEVAGPRLAERATALRVHRGRLELAVPSAVGRTHLSFSKQQLLDRINQRLGQRVVRDLVFVNRPAGDGDRPPRTL